MQFHRANRKHPDYSKPTIVGTGLVALDVVFGGDCASAEMALGGSAGNVLAILGHLGWHAVPVAQLGKDAAATRIANEFSKLGADTRFLLQSQKLATPVVYQFPGGSGHSHEFSFRCPICGRKRGFVSPSDDVEAMSHLGLIDEPDVFYFDRVTPWALELAERYRQAGTLVVFEPSMIGGDSASFERAIRAANVLKYADDRIADMQDLDLSCVDVEIQTHGKHGLRFRVAEQAGWHHLKALVVPYVTDTAGAGDWCTSGFLYALVGSIIENGGRGQLSTRRVRESLRFGQILAALNCMEKGARGLARRHRAEQLVALAASIRNSMALSIPQGARTTSAESVGTHRGAPLTTTDGISSLLCCEALAG